MDTLLSAKGLPLTDTWSTGSCEAGTLSPGVLKTLMRGESQESGIITQGGSDPRSPEPLLPPFLTPPLCLEGKPMDRNSSSKLYKGLACWPPRKSTAEGRSSPFGEQKLSGPRATCPPSSFLSLPGVKLGGERSGASSDSDRLGRLAGRGDKIASAGPAETRKEKPVTDLVA